jgi:type IV pilus assembly protein PilA
VQVIANLKARTSRKEGQDGFTLIELMVVVLIIAILIAIAIPTFLGARERAQDRAAQSSLRNGLTAGKTIFTDNEDYTDATPGAAGALKAVEPSLDFVATATASTGPNELSVDNSSVTVLVLAAESKSGECFWIRDDVTGPGTEYHRAGGATCDAASAPAVFTGW